MSKHKSYRTSIDIDGETREQIIALLNQQLAASTRAAIDRSDELGDADTADLFTGMSRDLDKALWFMEAHLQA